MTSKARSRRKALPPAWRPVKPPPWGKRPTSQWDDPRRGSQPRDRLSGAPEPTP